MTFRTDPFLCPDVEKFSDFSPNVKKSTFKRPDAQFCAKWSTIGLIMHKKALKHENIGFR